MCRYKDKNLVRYEETIELHFDTTFKLGWLTLKNYGLVFHSMPWANPWKEVKEITIGIPAGTLTRREALQFIRFPGMGRLAPADVENFEPYGDKFGIEGP